MLTKPVQVYNGKSTKDVQPLTNDSSDPAELKLKLGKEVKDLQFENIKPRLDALLKLNFGTERKLVHPLNILIRLLALLKSHKGNVVRLSQFWTALKNSVAELVSNNGISFNDLQ